MAGIEPKRRGCLFYVGVTGVILLAFVLVAIFLGLRAAKQLFNQFTDTRPMTMPAVNLTPAQIAAVQQRVDDFRDAVRAHQPTRPLTLSAEDLDALLQADSDFAALKGKLFVTGLESNHVNAKISLPMEELGLPTFRGRYLNATATLGVVLRDGVLRILPQTVSAKGRPLQDIYLGQVQRQNLATDVNRDPRASAALDRIESIEVQDHHLVITPKSE